MLEEVFPSKPSVLVVDDAEEIRGVLSDILEGAGYKVSLASGAGEAIKLLASEPHGLILCDVMMPESDGFDLFDEIRKSADWSEIPFVFLTALSNQKDISKGYWHGCDGYLTKPFEPEILLSIVSGNIAKVERRRKTLAKARELDYRRIVQMLSHEFRTPLVSVNTGAELLIEHFDTLDPKEIQNLLKSVSKGGRRLEKTVNDFMQLQQLDHGERKSANAETPSSWHLAQMVMHAIEQSERFGLGAVDFCGVADDVCNLKIQAIAPEVIDALSRVIDNALKFNPREREVMVSVVVENQIAKVIVRDFGPGISQRELSRNSPMMPLTQIGRDLYEQQGCGLGLTIAHHLLSLNKGKLVLENVEPGLQAIVTFPALSS